MTIPLLIGTPTQAGRYTAEVKGTNGAGSALV